MNGKTPYPYYTPPGNPPSSGRGADEDLRREVYRVREQLKEILFDVLAKHESLLKKAVAMDEEIDRLLNELIRLKVEITNAAFDADTSKLRSLRSKAEKLAEELLKKLEEADKFNMQVYKEWPSLIDRAVERIDSIVSASSLPEYVRKRMRRKYILAIEDLEYPTSAYGDEYSYRKSQIESILEEIRELERGSRIY
jgi:hypothetical protein